MEFSVRATGARHPYRRRGQGNEKQKLIQWKSVKYTTRGMPNIMYFTKPENAQMEYHSASRKLTTSHFKARKMLSRGVIPSRLPPGVGDHLHAALQMWLHLHNCRNLAETGLLTLFI